MQNGLTSHFIILLFFQILNEVSSQTQLILRFSSRATFVSALTTVLLLTFELIEASSQAVDTNQRVDCLPSRYPVDKKEECARVGCIWDIEYDQYNPTVPLCYMPATQGYQVDSVVKVPGCNINITLKWPASQALKNPYSEPNLDIQVEPREMGAALAVRIGRDDRFTPTMLPLDRKATIETSEKLVFKYSSKPAFSFTVERQSDGLKLWDTTIGGLLFGDQYIQIATFLPTDRIYGFGENLHHQLKHDFSGYKTWAMFARDQPEDSYTPGSVNEYGVHPFYMGLEPSGKAHGVLILNTNAQEYTLGPAPHLIYRTIGGQLELFFFPGPTPELVVQQYQQLIGRPYLPAYWAFGFQICRYGYKTLDDVKAVVKRTRDAQIPFDVQYADINYMERYKDFTYDTEKWAGFPEYADELHSMGMKLFLIFDPPVQVNYSVYQRGLKADATFVQWPSADLVQKEINEQYEETNGTMVMLAVQWPDYHAAFPDWLDPEGKTTQWWVDEFVRFRKELPFDGIWIDMNEPSVFGTNMDHPFYYDPDPNLPDKPAIPPLQCPTTGNQLDFPPYRTWNVYQYDTNDKQVSLCQSTLCMIGRTGRGKYTMYDTHSLYGWSEMVATQKAIRAATGGKRGAVISRSTFPSSGQFGGHWLGDNESKWPDLRLSIIGIQEFNMFGIPQVGADVCGFGLETNEELCLRWQQLGAFYSYYRNHNTIGTRDQDPAQWPSVAKVTSVANLFRYRHLPYLYSLHFRATLEGGTVVRPLFFEFPSDANTYELSFQFMWGPAMVVVPVISPNVDTVRGYLPPTELWYSMSDAHQYGSEVSGGYSTFAAPRDTPLPVFLRAGHIIPRQVPAMTTEETRKQPFQLLVALTQPNSGASQEAKAVGELFWDDGETAFDSLDAHPYVHLQFAVVSSARETVLQINCSHSSSELHLPTLDQIEVFGHLPNPVLDSLELNGAKLGESVQINYDSDKHLLLIERQAMISLNCSSSSTAQSTTLRWQNVHSEPSDGGNGAAKPGGLIGTIVISVLVTLFVSSFWIL